MLTMDNIILENFNYVNSPFLAQREGREVLYFSYTDETLSSELYGDYQPTNLARYDIEAQLLTPLVEVNKGQSESILFNFHCYLDDDGLIKYVMFKRTPGLTCSANGITIEGFEEGKYRERMLIYKRMTKYAENATYKFEYSPSYNQVDGHRYDIFLINKENGEVVYNEQEKLDKIKRITPIFGEDSLFIFDTVREGEFLSYIFDYEFERRLMIESEGEIITNCTINNDKLAYVKDNNIVITEDFELVPI